MNVRVMIMIVLPLLSVRILEVATNVNANLALLEMAGNVKVSDSSEVSCLSTMTTFVHQI